MFDTLAPLRPGDAPTHPSAPALRRPGPLAADRMAALDCIELLNAAGRLVFISDRGLRALDVAEPGDLLHRPWPEIWPRRARSAIASAVSRAATGGMCSFIAERRTRYDQTKTWDVTLMGIPASDGSIAEILAVSRETFARPTV